MSFSRRVLALDSGFDGVARARTTDSVECLHFLSLLAAAAADYVFQLGCVYKFVLLVADAVAPLQHT